jgi:hypothetical protein
MEAKRAFETSVCFKQTLLLYVLEERTLRNHRCENPKSYMRINKCEVNDAGNRKDKRMYIKGRKTKTENKK